MTKRKRKSQLTLIILLLAFVLLSAFYILYLNRDKFKSNTSYEDRNNESIVDSTLIVATMDPELIDKIHFKNEKADMTLILKEGRWLSQADSNRPIKQNYVQNMIKLIDEIKVSRVVSEKPEELKQYGLLEPYASIEASQSDGKSISLKIGNKVAGGQGYYAKLEENDAVYLLPVIYGTNLSYSDANMTQVEHGPSIDSNNIYHVEILKREGEDFELIYDPESLYHNAGTPLLSWAVLKPYDEAYAADSSKIYDLLANYANFSFLNCVEYQTDEYAKYRLEDPTASIFIEYYEQYMKDLEEPEKDPATGEEITSKVITEEKSFKLLLGDIDENGDYYVRKDGDKAVYTMKASNVETMLNVDAFNILSAFISLHNIETVEKIDIDIEGIAYTMEIKRDGDTASYYYNGEITSEDVFKDVYKAMIGAKVDTQLKEEASVAGQQPILTIAYHINGNDQPQTTSYYSYDDSFYLIDSGYPIRFVADKRKIDSIINAIKEFKPIED